MKKALLWFTAGILIALFIIFLIPGSKEKLALEKEKFFGGEYWRLATYSLTHLNWQHLIENLVGLALVGFIAYELKTNFSDYTATYLSSAMLAVLPVWFLLTFVALGASGALYALFGFVSFGVKKFGLKAPYFLAILTLIIFYRSIRGLFTGGGEALRLVLIQDVAHFNGLVFGVAMYGLLLLVHAHTNKKRTHILRRM